MGVWWLDVDIYGFSHYILFISDKVISNMYNVKYIQVHNLTSYT